MTIQHTVTMDPSKITITGGSDMGRNLSSTAMLENIHCVWAILPRGTLYFREFSLRLRVTRATSPVTNNGCNYDDLDVFSPHGNVIFHVNQVAPVEFGVV